MSTQPFFSIVIPTYNRADMIGETLDCVLAQTFQDFEILVVDNCSTDRTTRVMENYLHDRRIQYIVNEQNMERSYSRNRGMKAARGTWLTLLDSDDFMYPDCLQDAKNFIEYNKEVYLFQNKYELVDNDRKVLYRYPFPSLKNPQKALTRGNYLSCIGVFLHRDIFTNIHFDENPELTGSEDYEYWFRVLAHYNPGRINKINSGIRQHPERSINENYVDRKLRQLTIIERKIHEDPALYKAFFHYLYRLRASFYLYAAINAGKASGMFYRANFVIRAIWEDPGLLATRRPWSILNQIFRRK